MGQAPPLRIWLVGVGLAPSDCVRAGDVAMTSYPTAESDRIVHAHELRSIVGALFERCDMLPADAALLADSLVAADLRGVHSHGVLRVPEYVKKLRQDGVDPGGRPRVVRDAGAALVI